MSDYVHREAFMLMSYVCIAPACRRREVVYNARDGVTPIVVRCRHCGASARHVQWWRDVRAPGHVPEPGDLMFLDTSMETLIEAKTRWAREQWNDPFTPLKDAFPGRTVDQVAAELADQEWAQHDGHVPSLVVQTEEMQRAMEAESV